MKQHWEGEKQAIDAIRSLKEELGQLGQQLERLHDLDGRSFLRRDLSIPWRLDR